MSTVLYSWHCLTCVSYSYGANEAETVNMLLQHIVEFGHRAVTARHGSETIRIPNPNVYDPAHPGVRTYRIEMAYRQGIEDYAENVFLVSRNLDELLTKSDRRLPDDQRSEWAEAYIRGWNDEATRTPPVP